MNNVIFENYLCLLLCIGLTCILIFVVVLGVMHVISVIQEESEARKKVSKSGSYVDELRKKHTCYHCMFCEQCQTDAEQEGAVFDYLVCEEFREV